MKKFISIFAAVSMLASMFVMPAVHADYTFDKSSANFIAGTDFENNNPTSGHAYAFMNDTNNTELSNSIKHSGSWSLHTTAESAGNAHFQTADWSWAYWNNDAVAVSSRSNPLTVGETYKYSYWVYADESATVFTPTTLVSNGSGGYDWKIEDKNYSGLSKETWNYFETVFTAKATSLPFFFNIPANLYIDDIKLEKVVGPTLVSTTLPDEGGIAELGYNKYTMTFDKDIASATVSINGSSVTPAINGKTVEFGLRLTDGGEKTIDVTVKNSDGAETTVSRKITVPQTLVAYAGFDDNSSYNISHYLTNVGGGALINTEGDYYSPNYSARIVDTDTYWNDIRFNGANWSGVKFNSTKAVETGKWYKMSFYAKRADSTQTPVLGVAQENTSYGQVTMNSDTMTKYEVTFKATMTSMPRFYREQKDGDIYIDDILIQEVEAPRDYTFTANTGKITAVATLTATLTNERLESMDGIVIMALYKDKRFVEAKMVTASNLAKFASVTTDAITVPADISDGVYTAKAFLWDKTLVPIQKAVVINE